jgi:hypothetical protein
MTCPGHPHDDAACPQQIYAAHRCTHSMPRRRRWPTLKTVPTVRNKSHVLMAAVRPLHRPAHPATFQTMSTGNGRWWAMEDSEFLPYETAPADVYASNFGRPRCSPTYSPTGGLAIPSGRHTAGKWTRQPQRCTVQRPDSRQCI